MAFEDVNRAPVTTVVDGRPLAVQLAHARERYLKRVAEERANPQPEILPVHPRTFRMLLEQGWIDQDGRFLVGPPPSVSRARARTRVACR